MRIFFYGTLRDAEVRGIVLGAATAGLTLAEATLAEWRCVYVRGRSYPVILPATGGTVAGVLADGIDEPTRALLIAHEGPAYRLRTVEVELTGGERRTAHVFGPGPRAQPTSRPWLFDAWVTRERSSYVRDLRARYSTVR